MPSSVAITADVLATANRLRAAKGRPPAFALRVAGSGRAAARGLAEMVLPAQGATSAAPSRDADVIVVASLVSVSEAAVMAQVGTSPSMGRPHIADALIEAGHVRDRQEAFDRFLSDGGPAHVSRYAIPLERGIDLVHAAGGLAVIAHPWGRGRERLLPPDVLAALAADHALDGIEVDHQDHDRPTRRRLRKLAARLGLLGTGSSDYHGTGKEDHDLGCNTTDPAVYDEIVRRLVAAAR